MEEIVEYNVCGTWKHSNLIIGTEGEIILNICEIGSKAVNETGGLTICKDWTSRRKKP